MTVKRLLLNFGSRSVDFRIGADALGEFGRIARVVVGRPQRAFLIWDSSVEDELKTRIERQLIDAEFRLASWTAPAGEEALASAAYETLFGELARAGITADDVIVGVGRTQVTSLAAFAGKFWCGGTACVLVPTCLEGMVTAATVADPLAIAGTDGRVLLAPEPNMVFCDIDLIDGPADPAGSVYLVGAAITESRRAWERLKEAAPRLGRGEAAALVDAICNAQTARRMVVSAVNPSARHALSFGITTARALRSCLSGKQGGEAPWWQLLAEGMRFEARLATEVGAFPVDEVFTLDDCFEDLGIPELAFALDRDTFLTALTAENARWANRLLFALPKAFGSIRLSNVDEEVLARHAEAYLASRAELVS